MERPTDLVYALDERPPFLQWLLLGLQHVVVICPYLVLVALVVEAAKVPSSRATEYMAMAMLGVVLHTILQSLRTRFLGSGYLAPPVVSAIYLPACLAAAAIGGLSLVAGMVVVAGMCEMGLSRIVTRLRKVFPAVLSGIILMAVGIELANIGLSIAWSSKLVKSADFGSVELIFLCALTTMIGLSVWGKGFMRLFCALIGILVGYFVAVLVGDLPADLMENFRTTDWLALPHALPPGLSFDASIVVPFAIAGIASGLRTVGVLTTCQQMNDATWSRPDVKSISGGVLADGLGCAVGGVFSAPGLSASPSLVGIERATGATSRSIVWSIASWFAVLACLPKLSIFIVHMPRPVMAAALFFNGAFMFVGGMQIALSRPVTIRSTFLIGTSMMLAVGTVVYPGFLQQLPAWTRQITQSPISIATVSGVILNLFFLLGRWHFRSLSLDVNDRTVSHAEWTKFLTTSGKEWKLRPNELARIRQTVEDLLDRIATQDLNQDTVALRAGWDEFDVIISIRYHGSLPDLRSHRPTKHLVEEQAFISGLTGYLSDLDADRIDPSIRDGLCEIRLVFRAG